MQPLKWDTASRTAADSINIYVAPETPRTSQNDSFGSHLHNPPLATATTQQPAESYRDDSVAEDSTETRQSSSSSGDRNDLEENRQQPVVKQAAESEAESSELSDNADSSTVDAEKSPAKNTESTAQAGEPRNAAQRSPLAKTTAKQSPEVVEEVSVDKLTTDKPTSRTKVSKGSKPTLKTLPAAAKQRPADIGTATDQPSATAHVAETQSDPGKEVAEESATTGPQNVPVSEKLTAIQTAIVVDPAVQVAEQPSEDAGKHTNSERKTRGSNRKEVGAIDTVDSAGTQPAETERPTTVQSVSVETAGLSQSKTELANGATAETPAATSELNPSAPASPRLRFAQHLAAKPGERVAKAAPLTDVEQVRLVERVTRAFRAAEGRGGVVTLRLHPPELGALRVELRVQDGAMSARLEAETSAARSILIDNAHILRDRLAEQGVRIERFDVDLLDRRPPDDSPTFDQQGPRDQADRRPTNIPIAPLEPTDPDSQRPNLRPNVAGQLNVIV